MNLSVSIRILAFGSAYFLCIWCFTGPRALIIALSSRSPSGFGIVDELCTVSQAASPNSIMLNLKAKRHADKFICESLSFGKISTVYDRGSIVPLEICLDR